MSTWTDRARWRAMGTAALLVVSGGVIGILVDRLWLSPPEAQATALTPDAMAAHLGLSAAEQAHLRTVLDSLHAELFGQGADSLPTAVRNAQLRIEAALPPDARPGFRAWMQEHHEQLRHRMHRGPPGPGGR